MERYRDNKTNNRPDSRSYTRPVKNRSRKRRSRPVKNRSRKRRSSSVKNRSRKRRSVKNRSRKRRSRPVKNRSKKRRDWWNAKNLSGTGLQVLHENRESSIE